MLLRTSPIRRLSDSIVTDGSGDDSMRRQAGFFDVDDRLKRLSDLGDQLEAFEAAVEFEAFRPELNAALTYSDGTQGGRPPFDPVMMFKILVIQTTNNLSDERAEFLINDRLSFMRFLGFGLSDRVPDARTIWLFREKRHEGRRHRAIVRALRCNASAIRIHRHGGPDRRCSLIAAPRQRNTQDEKKAIKDGRVCAMDFSTRPTRRAASGRTPLTDRRPTRSSWKGTASSAMSIVRGRRGARCRKRSGAPTTPNRKSVRASSMFSPSKRTGWVCSSGPSGSRERRRRSDWRTSLYNIKRLLFLRRIAAA